MKSFAERMHPSICIFFFLLTSRLSAVTVSPQSCVDSVIMTIAHVSCHGLRDGGFMILEVKGGQPPFHYSLDNQRFTTNPEFDRLWAGDYTLWVHDATGCEFQQRFSIRQPHIFGVELTTNKTHIKYGESIKLEASIFPSSQEIRSIRWYPTVDFLQQDVLTQEIMPTGSQKYGVWVVNQQGCTAVDSLQIFVETAQIFIPNVFKPGSNLDGFFTVYAGEGVRQVRTMQIYNRWGRQIFENRQFPPNDPLKGWNGKVSGKLAAPDVYTYLVEIEYLDGKVEQKTGSITLILDTK